MYKKAFEEYINEYNREGSGKASSYIRALDLLVQMLQLEPFSFSDCSEIWSINSVERLHELREFVRQEQKRYDKSKWKNESIPDSYLKKGYCSAALTQLIEFLPQYHYSKLILQTVKNHTGDDAELKEKLTIEPDFPASLVENGTTTQGQDIIRQLKTRIGQRTFRTMVMSIYQNRCCITGIDIPEVNRASHIVAWAKRKDSRMDPRNGLCLSATYDAAFDKHLISFDQDYRLLISKTIGDHYTSESVKLHFLQREGQSMELPKRYPPIQNYLEEHRKTGNF